MNRTITLRKANGEETQIQTDNNSSIDLAGVSQASLPFKRSDIQGIQFDGAQLELTLSPGDIVTFDSFSDDQGVLVPLFDQNGNMLFANITELLTQLEATAAGPSTSNQTLGNGSGFTPEEDTTPADDTNDNSYRNLRESFGNSADDDSTGSNGTSFTAAPNLAPAALDDEFFYTEAQQETDELTGNLLTNDYDLDNVELFVASAQGQEISDDFTTVTLESGVEVAVFRNGLFVVLNHTSIHGDLAEGETTVDQMVYTVSDSLHETEATLTFTVTGTNDAPIIVAEPDFGATEDGEIIQDQVVATDADSDDDSESLTYSLVGEAPAGLTFNDDGSYSFDPSVESYQDLAQGETREASFSWKASDKHDADSDTETVTVTITGTNDAPVVTATDVTGGVTELVTPAGDLTDSGTIAFTDVDLTDAHSVTAVTPSDGALGTLTASVTTDTTGTGLGGVVTWDYSVAASAVEYLAADESVTEPYTVTVTDEAGAPVTQDVVITIQGTNDAPTITSAVQSGTVTEDAATTADPSDVLEITGTVSFDDIDLTDTHTVGFTQTAGSTTLGAFVLGAVTEDGATVGGSAGWTYTLNNAAAQYLAADESVTETYTVTVTVTDETGAPVTQNVVITIQGTNDAPTITSAVQGGTVTEDAATTADPSDVLEITGTVSFDDIDLTDTLPSASPKRRAAQPWAPLSWVR